MRAGKIAGVAAIMGGVGAAGVAATRRLSRNRVGAGHAGTAGGNGVARASVTIAAPANDVEERLRHLAEVPGVSVLGDAETTVRPAPGDRGTEVHAKLPYEAPLGPVGELATRLAGESPQQSLRGDLRRVKSLLECGEVVQVAGQPSGRNPVQRRVQGYLAEHARIGGRA